MQSVTLKTRNRNREGRKKNVLLNQNYKETELRPYSSVQAQEKKWTWTRRRFGARAGMMQLKYLTWMNDMISILRKSIKALCEKCMSWHIDASMAINDQRILIGQVSHRTSIQLTMPCPYIVLFLLILGQQNWGTMHNSFYVSFHVAVTNLKLAQYIWRNNIVHTCLSIEYNSSSDVKVWKVQCLLCIEYMGFIIVLVQILYITKMEFEVCFFTI